MSLPSNPYNPPDLSFNQFITAEPVAVIFQGKIYIYFSAVGANIDVGTTWQTIGLIMSDDGLRWSESKMVLKPKKDLYPRAQYLGYSTPAAIVMNNQMLDGTGKVTFRSASAFKKLPSGDWKATQALSSNPADFK